MQSILVTSYVNPDLDGIASVVAYAEFLKKISKKSVAGIIGEPHFEAKYIFDRFGFSYPESIINTDNFDEVILIDASDLNVLEGKILPEKVVEIIDHRKVHEADKFPKAKVQIELVGSVATLVAEKFIKNNIKISKKSATLLFSAIISNTLNFKGSVATDRDKKVAKWLNQVAKLPEDFWKDLFIAKSDLSDNKLTDRINDDFAWFVMGGKKVGIAQIEMIGAKKLIKERGIEIIQTLENLKKKMNLDFVFQNIIELENCKSFFVTSDVKLKELLEKVLDVRFSGISAEKSQLIMRKQIVPLLKQELEKADY